MIIFLLLTIKAFTVETLLAVKTFKNIPWNISAWLCIFQIILGCKWRLRLTGWRRIFLSFTPLSLVTFHWSWTLTWKAMDLAGNAVKGRWLFLKHNAQLSRLYRGVWEDVSWRLSHGLKMLAVAGESAGTRSLVFSYTRPANEVIQSGSPLTLRHAYQIRVYL